MPFVKTDNMHSILIASTKTLLKTKYLLDSLSDSDLRNSSIAPYHSTIGTHIRHILDFYACIFAMNENKIIDLTARTRDRTAETNCETALQYLNSIASKIKDYKENLDEKVLVRDNLGTGSLDIPYTLAAVFAQANSHTIHHYAIINYILNGLNVSLKEDNDFGYNPTTPVQSTQESV